MRQLPLTHFLIPFRWTIAFLATVLTMRAQEGGVIWSRLGATGTSIYSSPALSSNATTGYSIYVGTEGYYLLGSTITPSRLYSFTSAGAINWTFSNGLVTDWVDSSPAVGADGAVTFGVWDGKAHTIAPGAGSATLRWTYSGAAGYISSSPALASDGTVYVGSGDSSLHAINPNGTAKWTYPVGDWIDSSPAVGGDGTIYFGSYDNNVYALHPNGTLRWQFATGDNVVSSPAIGADGTVFIGSNDSKIYALDGATGAKRWEYLTGGPIAGSPVISTDGRLYVGSLDGYFYALNVADGSLIWRYNTSSEIYSSAAIRADGVVLFGADFYLYALNANGTLRWRTLTGDYVDSSPVIAGDGTIYVGSADGRLYSIRGNGQTYSTTAPWPLFRRDPQRTGRAPASATPAKGSQTIAFDGPGDLLFTLSTVALSATATSGLPVSFTVLAGPANLSDSDLTLTGLGTVTLRADQAGNSNYNAAPSVTRSFTVTGSYAYWQLQNFSAEEIALGAITGPGFINAADNLPNLVKYALGLPPKTAATTGLPETSVSSGNLIYTYKRPTGQTDVTVSVQTSTNLTLWNDSGVAPTLIGTAEGFDTWTVAFPLATNPNLFLRLKVTRP